MTSETHVEGDWEGDFGDATCYAPPVLIGEGLASCDEAMVELGWATVAREYAVIDDFLESPEEALIGGLGLTQVYTFVPDPEVATQCRSLIELVETTLPVIGLDGLLPVAMSEPYGQTAATAIVVALMLMYVDLVDADDAHVLERGLEIAADIRAASYDDAQGFYRRAPDVEELYLYPNVAMMLVHTLTHRLTGDAGELDEARALLTAIEPLRVAEVGAYHSPYQGEADDYISLSSQNYLTMALIYLFDETGDAALLEAATAEIDFIQEFLLHEGIAYHHWENSERAGWYCTGCNFQLLFVLWQLGLRG